MLILSLEDIYTAKIVNRISRIVVKVKINGRSEYAHLTNTGRLKEILVENRKCILKKIRGKKLRYRIIGVEDVDGYNVIDTITQNKVFEHLIIHKKLPYLSGCIMLKRNPRFDSEVFDYLYTCGEEENIIETKSAVLRLDRRALYPDCPTQRGRRQIEKLMELELRGYKTWLIFIVALPQVECFMPYEEGDKEIYRLVSRALLNNVNVKAFSIHLEEDGNLYLDSPRLKLCEEWLDRIYYRDITQP
jgi:sugar fermentation stimulation protein A